MQDRRGIPQNLYRKTMFIWFILVLHKDTQWYQTVLVKHNFLKIANLCSDCNQALYFFNIVMNILHMASLLDNTCQYTHSVHTTRGPTHVQWTPLASEGPTLTILTRAVQLVCSFTSRSCTELSCTALRAARYSAPLHAAGRSAEIQTQQISGKPSLFES